MSTGLRLLVVAAMVAVALSGCKRGDKAPASQPASALAGIPGAPFSPDDPALAKPAITVNGTEISEGKVQQAMLGMARAGGAPLEMLPPQIKAQIRAKAEEHAIARTLLKQYAVKNGIAVEPDKVAQRYQSFLGTLPPGATDQDLPKLLGATPEQMKKELEIDVAIDAIIDRLRTELKPDEETIKQYYETNKARYTTPDQASVSHILLRVASDAKPEQVAEIKKKAEALAAEARRGDAKAFAALADKNSQDPSAIRNHGDMGWFAKETMVPEFAEVAFKLKVGEVSDPVKTQFGFHVIRGQGQRKAGDRTIDEVRQEIEQQLTEQKLGVRIDGIVEVLRQEAKIERFGASAVPPPAAPAVPTPPPAAAKAPLMSTPEPASIPASK
ncbi:MAG: peptidylprolyl isomerase [Deltaproteobacteria bacterium]|nr:peptidylprolyl isomerase [Deltaproteobacteria bacterium]